MCAEFHCRPSQAIRELQCMPVGFVEEVILARRYVEAYYANAANTPGWEKSEMRTLAHEIEFEFAKEEIEST